MKKKFPDFLAVKSGKRTENKVNFSDFFGLKKKGSPITVFLTLYSLTSDAMNYPNTTGMRPPSPKQLAFIKSLSWDIRPYYLHQQWGAIRTLLLKLLRHGTRQDCDRLIKRMLSVLKQKQNARKVWIPMNYSLQEPAWQKNIARLATHYFPEESFNDMQPDEVETWRALKNRVERAELQISYDRIPDDFENDTRAAEWEEERWKEDKTPYAQIVAGIDYLEPVAGIDY